MTKLKLKEQILTKCDKLSVIMKSLSNPNRLKILCLIGHSNKTVCELAEFCNTSQSAMSQLLLRMSKENIINSRKEGTTVYYKICDPKIYKVMQAIYKIYCGNT